MMLDLNKYHGKIPDFVSFPLFGFTIVVKQQKFDIESHSSHTLTFFDKKRYVLRFKYVPRKNV